MNKSSNSNIIDTSANKAYTISLTGGGTLSCAESENVVILKSSVSNYVNVNNKAKYGGSFKLGSGKEVYIKQVLYTPPATVVWWSDDTQTKDICPKSAEYNPDSGLAFCVLKKLMGNKYVGKLFNDWEMSNTNNTEKREYVTLANVRAKHKK